MAGKVLGLRTELASLKSSGIWFKCSGGSDPPSCSVQPREFLASSLGDPTSVCGGSLPGLSPLSSLKRDIDIRNSGYMGKWCTVQLPPLMQQDWGVLWLQFPFVSIFERFPRRPRICWHLNLVCPLSSAKGQYFFCFVCVYLIMLFSSQVQIESWPETSPWRTHRPWTIPSFKHAVSQRILMCFVPHWWGLP